MARILTAIRSRRDALPELIRTRAVPSCPAAGRAAPQRADAVRPRLPAFVGRSEQQEPEMVALTFPDGARRDYPTGITGLDIAKGISPSLAKRTVAMALDGSVADLADQIEKDAKIEFLSRDDPRALELIRHDCRARAGRSRAVAVARHAGHHRPGDRERLLLRLLPQPAVHAGRLRRDREEDARDHRARQTLHQGSLVARRGQAACSATRARRSRSSWSTPSRRTRSSRSTSRATGSTSAAART